MRLFGFLQQLSVPRNLNESLCAVTSLRQTFSPKDIRNISWHGSVWMPSSDRENRGSSYVGPLGKGEEI